MRVCQFRHKPTGIQLIIFCPLLPCSLFPPRLSHIQHKRSRPLKLYTQCRMPLNEEANAVARDSQLRVVTELAFLTSLQTELVVARSMCTLARLGTWQNSSTSRETSGAGIPDGSRSLRNTSPLIKSFVMTSSKSGGTSRRSVAFLALPDDSVFNCAKLERCRFEL